jgi:hypothetical protein
MARPLWFGLGKFASLRAARYFAVGAVLALPLFLTAQVRAEPSPDGKGIAGGALLGAEIAVFGEAIAGLETPWLYWVGAGVAGVGGGVGGYFVETSFAPRTSYYLLAGGMALSIPAMIVYLDATNEARASSTDPSTGPDYDEEPLDELDAAATAPAPLAKHRLTAPMDWDGGWRLQAPSVVLSPTHTPFETSAYGVQAATRVCFPLVSGAF